MNAKRKKAIAALAAKTLRDSRATKAPVDVEAIATEHTTLRWQEADSGVSGLFAQHGHEFLIGVNADHSLEQQRFTIAHEIGHYFLHRHHQEVWIDAALFRRTHDVHNDDLEDEANYFAYCLLIPEVWLRSDLDRLWKSADLNQLVRTLAQRYNVSEAHLTLRLVDLGILRR